VQEIVDIIGVAFDTADRYRCPVMLVADGILGQMMEPVELPEAHEYKVDPQEKPWAATGWKPGDKKERAVVNSLYIGVDEMHEMNMRLQNRYRIIEKEEVRFESYGAEDAEILVCAYGTVARICKAAIDELAEQGLKIRLIRPITLWPFPMEAVQTAAAAPGVKAVLTVELNAGQMVEDVRLAVDGVKPVRFLGNPGSKMPTVGEIRDRLIAMSRGED